MCFQKNSGVNVKKMECERGADDDINDDYDCVHTVFCAVGWEGGVEEKVAPLVCDLQVEGQVVTFESDTDSPYTIMSDDTLKKLWCSERLGKSKETIKSLTGHYESVLGV